MNCRVDLPRLLVIVVLVLWVVDISLAQAGPGGGNRVVFVTSVTGTGDLGSWPDAGMATGLAAGDAICQARATAAGLANPSNFVAWISDMNDDAYCRVHNFSGTKAANCGQLELPATAGPWVRTDGFPFSEAIDQLLGLVGVVYSALQFDEFGNLAPAFSRSFTATSFNGELNVSGNNTDCGQWMLDTLVLVAHGAVEKTTVSWTAFGTGVCSNMEHLICMETLPGPPLPAFAETGRLAFVTSTSGSGMLSTWTDAGGNAGIAAGDTICQTQAEAEGLENPSSFKAWLSDDSTNAIDRFDNSGRWVRLDGVTVAESKADLIDGLLFSPINVAVDGTYLSNYGAWTGTFSFGTTNGVDCQNWMSADIGFSGTYGTTNDVRSWTGPGEATCNQTFARLYCLSDTPSSKIFSDGFE